jgi:hypothetical protein
LTEAKTGFSETQVELKEFCNPKYLHQCKTAQINSILEFTSTDIMMELQESLAD